MLPLSLVVIVPLPLLRYRPIGNIDGVRFASWSTDQGTIEMIIKCPGEREWFISQFGRQQPFPNKAGVLYPMVSRLAAFPLANPPVRFGGAAARFPQPLTAKRTSGLG
jgi:hypothetical protein